jgi:hypothetical protein
MQISYSQGSGIVRGKITDEDGEDLIGATVYLKNNQSTATIADFEGNFELGIPSNGPQIIVVSFVAHQTIEDTLQINSGKVIVQNYTLSSVTEQIEGVEVYARANRANDNYMKDIKMKSPVSIDYISKETIKKTGDSHVDDAVKRVTGVSTVQGFITVRGLADRYVKTTINGARIPTLDPLTNNIKLDMFPTSLVDNIVIMKTQSPDLPGDWAGAYLSIETKDYPSKLMVNVKTSVGFYPSSTFKESVTSEQGPTDWLGYDNGFRDFNHSSFSSVKNTPPPYEMFKGWGMENYLLSLGVNREHLNSGSIPYDQNIYIKLALVEMGVLAPGYLYNTEEAISSINRTFYNVDKRNEAIENLNNKAIETNAALAQNGWKTSTRQMPLSFSQDFSIGNQTKLFGRPLGLLMGFRYGSSYKADNTIEKIYYSPEENFNINAQYERQQSIVKNEWSALINTAYKLSANHSISLLFMPNFSGANRARADSGYSKSYEDEAWLYGLKYNMYYEERQQLIYQVHTQHYIPLFKLKINLDASYTDGKSSTPNLLNMEYGPVPEDVKDENSGYYEFPYGFRPARNFRNLDEVILDARLKLEFPISKKTGFVRKAKFGASYLDNTRVSEQYEYKLYTHNDLPATFNSLDEIFNAESFNFQTDNYGNLYVPMFFRSQANTFTHNIGYSKISAAYGMLDYEITNRVRISGGLRVEQSETFSDVKKFHELGLPENDSLRSFSNESAGAPVNGVQDLYANPANLEYFDFLPSINSVFKLINNEKLAMNIRASYGRSLARPSIREISPYWYLDYDLDMYVLGNNDMKITHINNYDLRFESYFNSGEFLSISFFRKDFENHIEIVNSRGLIRWENAKHGLVNGIEVEGKKAVIDNLFLGANLTLVQSNTKVDLTGYTGGIARTIDRPMFGQAPYVVNGLIDYTSDRTGITVALSYNIQGPKLAIISENDIYEIPRHQFDMKLSKSIGEHFSTELKIRNLLNQPVVFSYQNENNFDFIYDSYNYGSSYVFSLSYTL